MDVELEGLRAPVGYLERVVARENFAVAVSIDERELPRAQREGDGGGGAGREPEPLEVDELPQPANVGDASA